MGLFDKGTCGATFRNLFTGLFSARKTVINAVGTMSISTSGPELWGFEFSPTLAPPGSACQTSQVLRNWHIGRGSCPLSAVKCVKIHHCRNTRKSTSNMYTHKIALLALCQFTRTCGAIWPKYVTLCFSAR